MNKLRPDILLRVEDLFSTKKWDLNNNGNGQQRTLFTRFCERLQLFDAEQQHLIIELAYNYTRVELPIYLSRFYNSLKALSQELYDSYDKIFVYPLLNPNKVNQSKTKSAGFLYYMFDADDYTWLSHKFIPHTSIKYLKYHFDNKDSLLLLIDDFVGTGSTAIDVCNEYLSAETIDGIMKPESLKVVSIAAQIQGILNLKATLNIDVVSAMIFQRGISDIYFDQEKTTRLDRMEKIEKALGIEDEDRFGYGHSEALITMLHKTPNNTFPVYWFETRDKVAPFPRKKKYLAYGR